MENSEDRPEDLLTGDTEQAEEDLAPIEDQVPADGAVASAEEEPPRDPPEDAEYASAVDTGKPLDGDA